MSNLIPFPNIDDKVICYEETRLDGEEAAIEEIDSAQFAMVQRVKDLLDHVEEMCGPLHRAVMEMRFGLGETGALGTFEISEELGLSPRSIVRMEGDAMVAMRQKVGLQQQVMRIVDRGESHRVISRLVGGQSVAFTLDRAVA